MSKQSDKKKYTPSNRSNEHPNVNTTAATHVLSSPSPAYMQSYIPTPYVPQVQSQQFIQPSYIQPSYIQQPITTVIQGEPIVLPTVKKVVYGESLTTSRVGHSHVKESCCDGCAKTSAGNVGTQVVTRQVNYRPVNNNNQDNLRKLEDIERLHIQECKDIEFRMQNQIDQLTHQRQQEDQQRQMSELRNTIMELKTQITQPNRGDQSARYQQDVDKLERELSKKKNKIKNMKVHIDSITGELAHRNTLLQEYEHRLQQQEQILRLPPKETLVQVPINQGPPQELINKLNTLEREREDMINEINTLRGELRDIDRSRSQDGRIQGDWNRMVTDFRLVEQDNIKLNTIIGQKDDLIRSLEQRLSVELSRQSLLLSQANPQRVIVEQTTRPIATQYVVSPQLQPLQQVQPQLQQSTPTYVVTDQYVVPDQLRNTENRQVMYPTLGSTLPNVKIQN